MTARVPSAVALGVLVAVLGGMPAKAQPPGFSQGAPPRDARPGPTGTAIIRGRIVASDTSRPLRRARIRVTGPELGPQGQTTSTNLDGRYEFKDLPAGRYTLQASRSGYLSLGYGQRRPLETGKPLQVNDKQVLQNVDFALPRASVITGRISDELGEPVAETPVWAMRSTYWQGRRQLVPVSTAGARTDDAGQYRLTGLVPGTYYLMAILQDTWTVMENGVDTVFGYAPTYYPGATATSNARRVTVGLGQETGGVDFSLIPGRSASVSGTALDSRGRPVGGRSITLSQEVAGPTGGSFMGGGSATIAPDGTFKIRNIPPGEYHLLAQTMVEGSTPGAQVPEAVAMIVPVDGTDIVNLTLSTSAGWSATGRVVTEAGTAPSIPPSQVRLAGRFVDASTAPTRAFPNQDSGRVKDDWTFALTALFGPTRLRVTVPDGWMVKSIFHDGTDISDKAVEMNSGEAMPDLQVIITDRVTAVSGQLTDDKGAPAPDGTAIIFSEDAEKWTEDSRWVRSARPDQQGQYQIKGLPPGRYLAVAVDYVESGMWNDPEYLDSIRRYGQPLTLTDAGSQAISLKLVTPQ